MVMMEPAAQGKPPQPPAPERSGVWAVVVACNRPAELERLLTALEGQTIRIAGTIVVDNGTDLAVAEVARRHGAAHHRSRRNLGGAGGYAFGILLGLAAGADTLWLWDDDGWPDSPDCLARLLHHATAHHAAIVSPLVLSAADPARTAFGFRRNGRATFSRADLPATEPLTGVAHLFNGALLPAATIERFGLPDTRLFIRGDEEDFLQRVLHGGGHVATLPTALARHPSGETETHPLLGGRMFAVVPPDRLRREMLFRNKGYLFWRHRQFARLGLNVLRYALFYLARRRPDVAGYRAWLRLTARGIRERLGGPE